ncbi:MAG TPA: MFS transporter [Nocardioidaceae bacterium]|jgi:MFS family permease|nr:MFS transporter [Nocardioidaceae bacterium]
MSHPANDVTRDRRPLYGVLTAFAFSLTGTRIAAIALPWFVLVETDSATMTGLLALCEMAPYVLAKALGGPLVDSLGPRRVSVTADVVSGLTLGLIPLLWLAGGFHIGVVFAASAVFGAFRGPGDSAKECFVPDMAARAQVPLERVTGLSGAIERLASTVGPAAGGAVVALIGAVPALAVTALAALVSAALVHVVIPAPGPVHLEDADPERYLARLGAGYRFIREDGLIWSTVLMLAVTNFLDAALSSVLVPLWAKESGGGPAAIGLVGSCLGITAVLGSLCATFTGERLPRRATFLVGFLVGGTPRFVVLALDAPVWVVASTWAIAGVGIGFINPILSAVFFERTPRAMVGRANALADSLAWSLIPLGGVAAAGLFGVVGLAPALLVCGSGYLVSTTIPALRPEWHEMNRRRDRAGPTVAAGVDDRRTFDR